MSKTAEQEFNKLDASLFSGILNAMGEAIWVTDFIQQKSFWFASDINKVKYGVPDEPAVATFWQANLHPEDRDAAITNFNNAVQNSAITSFTHEYRFRGNDDVYYVVHDSICLQRDQHGFVTRAIGSWRDITLNKLREQKLEELFNRLEKERNHFKMIAEISNAAMWEIDFATDKLDWTAGTATLEEYGFNKPGYSIQDWRDAIHEDDRDRVVQNFDRAVANEEAFFDTYRFRKRDNGIVHVIDQGNILRDETGKALRAVGSWIDISRERNREEVLERSLEQQRDLNRALHVREEELAITEEELRQLNDQLSVSVQQLSEREFILTQSQKLARIGSWDYNPDRRTMYWSNEMYNIFGVDSAFDTNNLNGIQALFEMPTRLLIQEALEQMVNGHTTPFDISGRITTPLGYRKWLRVTAYPVLHDGRVERMLGLVFDNTYLKEAEERMRSSEQKFANAFRNSPDLMTILREEDNMIIDVNNKLMQVLGYERHEVVGRVATELRFFVTDEARAKFFRLYAESQSVEMECQWYRKDGSHIDILISSNRLEIEGVFYILSVIRDVSARNQAEERFRKSFDLNPDLMLIFRERDMVLVEVNAKVEALSGYTREEIIGTSSTVYTLWAIADERAKYFEKLARDGWVSVESVFLKKNGSHFLGTISSQRIQLHGESHVLVVVRDITQKKLVERNLIESEASLQSILNNTEYFIWSVDTRMKLQRFNSRFATYLRRFLKIDLFFGMPILDFTHSEDLRDLWTRRYANALLGDVEVFDMHAAGHIFRCMLTPMKVEGVITGVTAYMNDITSAKRAEEQLMLSEASLNATVNNTNFLVWSVDRNFKIMISNQPFRDYMRDFYSIEIVKGDLVVMDRTRQREGDALSAKWNARYQRGLAGETFELEEQIGDRFVKHSLSPIRGKDFISGVTVFSENITTQKLAENKIRENEIKLNAIINNTDLSIWSVDTEYRVTSLNKVFAHSMRTLYNVEFEIGQNMIEASRGFLPGYLIDYWTVLYKRAFSGEAVLEEYEGSQFKITTQNSVHPIIEGNKIVGASVYTRDITEYKRKSLELAEANKKIGELKLMALRSVMNPHFIFNALNSIQYFIAKNDRQNAINYLSTFSKLIRGVLTHSVNDKINIADELDLLKYYINLETVRFENKFEFVLEVDPNLDQENIEIPSLLIQPYVENAILHGLYNKVEKGMLKIKVCYEGDGVMFMVEDNGVGRQAAGVLREKNFPKHKSMGTVLTEERLRLINQRDNVSFQIEDLADDHGPAGTRVKIWVRI